MDEILAWCLSHLLETEVCQVRLFAHGLIFISDNNFNDKIARKNIKTFLEITVTK